MPPVVKHDLGKEKGEVKNTDKTMESTKVEKYGKRERDSSLAQNNKMIHRL